MSFSLTRLSSGTVLRHLFRVPGTSLSLPVYFLSGTSPGATLLVHAALHGSEVVGVEVIHRLLETLAPRDISGRVILVPVVNIPAFEEGRRCFSQTNQDLNRVFPGRSNGTLTERIAHLYFHKLVRCSDAIVDLHSTESPVLMLPHVRQRVLQPTQAHRDLMRATGLSALWIGPGVLGMLQVQAAGIGKPCVTVE
ncbi:MAG TPA: succinylglutamate desuccinylase/aspartoacylase family protein, partial [bacterium]|nr:succinylglutamate desuccinylase/aspartoacylase family protein [bacterium]